MKKLADTDSAKLIVEKEDVVIDQAHGQIILCKKSLFICMSDMPADWHTSELEGYVKKIGDGTVL